MVAYSSLELLQYFSKDVDEGDRVRCDNRIRIPGIVPNCGDKISDLLDVRLALW